MAFIVLFGVLGGLALLLIVTLVRRSRNQTESAEGLRIEEQARMQAGRDRVSFSTVAMHNAAPTASDVHHRRR
ncbi:hypothetical protein ACFY8C_27130 [Streptomyces flavochromogenes]|uniref:Uncharacterized protein n=1 Tax=Streptomyces flavochromogenes TaxID=68199 RepID=A0ABW6XWV5_9ACTN|nr:hypothetical protein [Streptomyces flavochromogenes]